MPTAALIDDYRKAAKGKFAYVREHLSDFQGWKLGNSLDTMIDCLVHVDSGGAESFGAHARTQCRNWIDGRSPDWTWFDDYGWFVISTDRASQQQLFFGMDVCKGFSDISKECWERFKNAQYTWEWRDRDPDSFKDYGPVVAGGVWNTLWEYTPEVHFGSPDLGDFGSPYLGDREGIPSAGALAGIQNTVTNALFLICAQRCKDAHAADQEYGFLDAWFSSQKQPNLWWPQNSGGALVRERPSRVGNGMTNPGFEEDWAWTGDQGLILGGLVGRIKNGQDAAKALRYAEALLTGVRLSLVDAHGVLQPFTATGIPPHVASGSPDYVDYQTGTGVFWRYLLQAWNLNNPDLRRVLGSEDYKKFVKTNADAAVKDGDKGVDALSNQIAALVAAIVMLA
jgi:hypothetical protein